MPAPMVAEALVTTALLSGVGGRPCQREIDVALKPVAVLILIELARQELGREGDQEGLKRTRGVRP